MNELTNQLNEQNARKICAKIRGGLEDVTNLVLQLYKGQGWAAIGYSSWTECCREEFDKSASWASKQVKLLGKIGCTEESLSCQTSQPSEPLDVSFGEAVSANDPEAQCDPFESSYDEDDYDHTDDAEAQEEAESATEEHFNEALSEWVREMFQTPSGAVTPELWAEWMKERLCELAGMIRFCSPSKFASDLDHSIIENAAQAARGKK